MSHKGLRLLIQDAAKSLGDDILFSYGRTSDFNQIRELNPVSINLDLLSASPTFANNNVSNYTKTWQVAVSFYMFDEMASTQEQYALILDNLDDLVDKFVNKLNTYSFQTNIDSDDILLSGFSQTPFIKALDAVLTGFTLTFSLQVSDQFNYCGLAC